MTSTHPTFGVEEEFLLVDPESGAPVPLNRAVAAQAEAHGVDLQLELTSCQVETTSSVASSSVDLRTELARLRRVSADAAASSGARLLAVALPPTVPHEFPVTDKPRYRAIAERFGMIAREQGICGCHVHVAVPNRELAVKVYIAVPTPGTRVGAACCGRVGRARVRRRTSNRSTNTTRWSRS